MRPNPTPSRTHGPDSSLVVRRFPSIRDIDEGLWDSLCADQGLFCSHRFIRAVEEARPGESRFHYLLFTEGGTPVAGAVLSAFDMSLDLLAGGSVQRAVGTIRRWLPAFLRIRILFCGLPVSIGKHALVIAGERWQREVVRLLSREMAAIARSQGIRLLCVKEFGAGKASVCNHLGEHRFIQAESLPYYRLRIRWESFPAYLASMRHAYRRRALASLRKLGAAEPVIEPAVDLRRLPDTPGLGLCAASAFPPAQFHDLYLRVMARAGAKLETLNAAFFATTFESLSRNLEVLFFCERRQVRSAAVVATDRGVMTFLLAGLSYSDAEKEYDAYHNLLYAMVALAIRRGCAWLDLGQTASWSKRCVGGEESPLHFFLRCENHLAHRVLAALNGLLFPVTKEPRLRVFHCPGDSPGMPNRGLPSERTT